MQLPSANEKATEREKKRKKYESFNYLLFQKLYYLINHTIRDVGCEYSETPIECSIFKLKWKEMRNEYDYLFGCSEDDDDFFFFVNKC